MKEVEILVEVKDSKNDVLDKSDKNEEIKERLGEFIIDFKLPIKAVAEVWQFGAGKYNDSGWKLEKKGCDKYTNAMLRHLLKEGKDNLIIDEDSGDVIGHKIRAKIVKNKFAPGEKEVSFDILYNSGITNIHIEAVSIGIKYNIIERPTQQTYVYKDVKYTSRANIEDFFKNHPEEVGCVIDSAKELAREAV